MFLSKDIEKWGSGIRRIYLDCKENNVSVEFTKLKTGFLVTFFRPKIFQGGVNGGVKKELDILLDLIKKENGLRLPTITQRLQKPKKSIEKWLQRLKSENKIEFLGSSKTGGYFPKK